MEREELELPRRRTGRVDPRIAHAVVDAGTDQDGCIPDAVLPFVLQNACALSGLSYSRVRRLTAGLRREN